MGDGRDGQGVLGLGEGRDRRDERQEGEGDCRHDGSLHERLLLGSPGSGTGVEV
jgi:hypothetical protein